ncbi:MAG: tyrosine-type recombinase/integrase [Candidatus Ventricola sp.]
MKKNLTTRTNDARISEGLQRKTNKALERTNLENLKADTAGISGKEQTDMAKRIKMRVDVGGSVRWATGETQQEVILAAAKILAESGAIVSTAKQPAQAPTFRECAIRWFDVYKRPKLKQNSAYNYEHDMNNHILPVFGDKRVDEIKPSDIQAFLNTKKDKAKSTVHHIWLILHGVFSTAVWDGYIEKDPTAEASRYTMSKRKAKRDALSTEAVQDIIKHLNRLEGNDLCLLSLLIYTGMRRSEVLGLRWEDIDWERGLIHVLRAVTFKDNQPVVGTTKSEAGVRYIPLDAKLRAILSPMRQLSGYVIGQDNPITETTYKRTWERIGRKIDLHGATAHVFRHTYITMAAAHVDIKTLQSIAGHADISTTMNRYAHGREDKIIAAGQALQTMYQ